MATTSPSIPKQTGVVLALLAAAQFLMTLDSSVMNVSISNVAKDVGTTVTGVQTAITLFTLVMASLMITGGKVGSLIGRRRAFSIGMVIYAAGSLVTAVAQSLPVLIIGWSLLEGIGAALIMPAIVALIAGQFQASKRASAYGTVAAAGAIAVAVGPLLGGAVTTFASWRWVFLGEVVLAAVLLVGARKLEEPPIAQGRRFDAVGAVLSIIGLSLAVLGVLKSGEWGWVKPVPGQPVLLGTSPVIWMIGSGLLVIAGFLAYEGRLIERSREPLVQPSLLQDTKVTGGLLMFFFQYLAQAGVFFTVPLFLSVVLELSAIQTGVRVLPLSLALLVSAVLVPRLFPRASPRRIVRVGLLLMIGGTTTLIVGVSPAAGAGVVAMPMLLLGLGIGAMSSQLSAVTVSAVPTSMSEEIGGLQNTATNLGASVGTALAGAVLIANLSAGLLGGISGNPAISAEVQKAATTSISSGVAFVSNSSLKSALGKAGVSEQESQAILDANTKARSDALDAALSVLALVEVVALGLSAMIRRKPLGDDDAEADLAVSA